MATPDATFLVARSETARGSIEFIGGTFDPGRPWTLIAFPITKSASAYNQCSRFERLLRKNQSHRLPVEMNQPEYLIQLLHSIRNAASAEEKNQLLSSLIHEINPGLEFFVRSQSVGDHAHDLLQDSFMQITNRLHTFRGTVDRQLKSFCDRITRRVVAKHLKKLKRNIVETYDPDELERIGESAGMSSGLTMEQRLDFNYVIEILRNLAKDCLELVTKRYVDGWDYQRIANTFGLRSADTARMRISRCCKEAEALLDPNH